ncbi:cellulose biosynthesis protein BcsR [Pseudomonas fluorescens]|uniref:Cellulose biosynthesis protein BcsR n=1 Tax=Pseudomonas fluorescens TaxID=294 RepID=A0A5E7FUY4_PSEFL|nr:cellulose biosynthesis protein BcsR [Pseudomonas fluorescens]VVO43146.1 hypothetical protein PS710_06150 [Pseudomonas fluorescens]
MAALPAKIPVKNQALSRTERADDIARLKVELKLPDLEYVDISAQLELNRAMRRWPLLEEFGFPTLAPSEPRSPMAQPIRQRKFGELK